MRDDMSKVLVESPRSGRAYAYVIKGVRRRKRNQLDPDGEGGLNHVGMSQGGNKHFGEHLGPLFRYLRGQVDRPWSKVYGELCAQLDRRSVVQAHLFQHIGDKVEIETLWQGEEVWFRDWRGLKPIRESRAELFVHPRTGILLVNRAAVIERRHHKQVRADQRNPLAPNRRVGLPGMAADCQWQRDNGLWFEVMLRPLGDAKVYDVLLKRPVCRGDRELLHVRYGRSDSYAITKRQLGHKELRAHGLKSQAEDDEDA